MTRRPPHPISEDELLDLVEGNLSEERVEALMPSLRADPELAARLKAMAHDRTTVKSALGASYAAPGGLLEGAFARADAARETGSALATGTSPSMPRIIGTLAAGVAITLGVAFAAQSFLFNETDARELVASGDRVVDLGSRRHANASSDESPQVEDSESTAPVRALASAQAPSQAPETITRSVAPAPLSDDELARAVRLAVSGELVLVIESPGAGLPFAALADAGTVRDGEGRVLVSPAALASDSDGLGVLTDRLTGALERGAYTVDAGDGVHAIVRAMEASGAVVRIERAEERLEAPARVDEILWWTPSNIRVPAERGTVRVIVRND